MGALLAHQTADLAPVKLKIRIAKESVGTDIGKSPGMVELEHRVARAQRQAAVEFAAFGKRALQ